MDGTTYDPFHGPRADKIRKSSRLVGGGYTGVHGLLGTGRAHDRNSAAVAESFREESGCGLIANRPTSAKFGNGSCRDTRSCVQRGRRLRCNESLHTEIKRPKLLEMVTTFLLALKPY